MWLFDLVVITGFTVATAEALSLDINDVGSIKSAAKSAAKGLIAPYNGTKSGEIPGIYGQPYGWWSAGAIWDGLIDYWYLTGDDANNVVVSQALLFQVGPNNDYMPLNQTKAEGNDDQSTWALAALTALERSFPMSTSSAQLSFLSLAQNVFDEQVLRWDTDNCAGGLRWQIFSFNNGYNYKNTLSNGQFFELAARLARFTGNATYADWASKSYAWAENVGLIGGDGSVFDGAYVTQNCSDISKVQWTASAGVFLHGSAVMYNLTKGDKSWQNRTSSILSHITDVFFDNKILYEVACETNGQCNTDEHFYKGELARDLARTAQAAPFTADTIMPLLRSSAQAAASVGCAGSGEECGFSWRLNSTTEQSDLGAQYSALEVIQGILVPVSKGLVTAASSSPSGTVPGNGSGASAPAKGSGERLAREQQNVVALVLLGLLAFVML